MKNYNFIYSKLTNPKTVDDAQNRNPLLERVVNERLTVVDKGLIVDDHNRLGGYFETIVNYY